MCVAWTHNLRNFMKAVGNSKLEMFHHAGWCH